MRKLIWCAWESSLGFSENSGNECNEQIQLIDTLYGLTQMSYTPKWVPRCGSLVIYSNRTLLFFIVVVGLAITICLSTTPHPMNRAMG